MKWIMLALIALPLTQVNAQNKKAVQPRPTAPAKSFDNLNKLVYDIPMQASSPSYDTTVTLSDDMTRDRLQENASNYFDKVFGSGFVNKSGKHKLTGMGRYTFSANSYADESEVYNVSYLMDISVKEGKYDVSLHSFSIEHNATEINIANKIEAAKRNDMKAKMMLAMFQKYNTQELKKVYASMAAKPAQVLATASR